MKKIVVILTASALFATGLTALPAAADSRISLSTTSQVVFNGSPVVLQAGISSVSGDSPSLDFRQLRFEVTSSRTTGGAARANFLQLTTSSCSINNPAVIGTPGNLYRNCEEFVNAGRSVFDLGVRNASDYNAPSLRLTPLGGPANRFSVRSWFDVNGNNRVDSFEPASSIVVIQSISASAGKAYMNFELEPLLVTEANFVAYVSANDTTGGGSLGLGLIDPRLLEIQLISCSDAIGGCSVTYPGIQWRSHPQLRRYEFVANTPISQGYKYTVNLIYNPSGEQGLNRGFLWGTRTVDYLNVQTVQATASIFSAKPTSSDVDQVELNLEADQAATLVDHDTRIFRYQAVLRDPRGNPVANQQAFLRLDLRNLSASNDFKIDAIQQASGLQSGLSSSVNGLADQITVSRISDTNGRVSIDVETGRQNFGSSVGIELITGGYRGKHISDSAREQLVVWGADDSRTLAVRIDEGVAGGGKPVTFAVKTTRSNGSVNASESVILDADENLILSRSRVGSSSFDVQVRVSRLAPRNGVGIVTVQALAASRVVATKLLFTWRDFGDYLFVEPEQQSPAVTSSYSGRTKANPGQTVKGTLFLRDAFSADVPDQRVSVSLSGPGRLLTPPKVSNESGRVPIEIRYSDSDAGVSKIVVRNQDSKILNTHYILVGVEATLELVDDRLAVTLANVKDSEVTVRAGTLTTSRLPGTRSAAYSIWDVPRNRATASVSVFGVQVLSKTLAFDSLSRSPEVRVSVGTVKGTVRIKAAYLEGKTLIISIDGKRVDTRTLANSSETFTLTGIKAGNRNIKASYENRTIKRQTIRVK